MDSSNKPQQMSKPEKISRKLEAGRLLKHPLIVEFFERGTQQLFDRFRNPCNPEGGKQTVEDRELISLELKGLQAFQMFFQEIIINGNMAEKEIAAEEAKKPQKTKQS